MTTTLLQQALVHLENACMPAPSFLAEIRAHLAAQPAPVPDFYSRQSPLVQDAMSISMVKAWSIGGRTDVVHPDFQCGFESGWESAAPVPVPPGWQPIETAPKDGEYMLLWCGWPVIGSSGVGKPLRGNHDWYEEQAGVNPIFGVTHWMPLPPPPGIAASPEVP